MARSRIFSLLQRPAARVSSLLVLCLLWQGAAAAHLIDPDLLASPSAIIGSLIDLFRNGDLMTNLLVSLRRVALGLVIAISVGGGLGLVAGLSRLGEVVVDAPMQTLRTIPFLGLIPLYILWFGIGETPKVALIATACAFPFYLNVYAGIRGVDPKLIELCAVLEVRGLRLIRDIIIPGALPSILVGFRLSLGIAWLCLIGSEQVNASSGLGYLINDARDNFRTDIVMACLGIYALLGFISDAFVRLLEAQLLGWRGTARA